MKTTFLPSSTDALGEQIVALAARLHAGTYELLVLLREFDDRIVWNSGFASCAHWIHWRTGIALGAAREKVRVAHALATLPLVSATMQRGAISYAKVRALTRVATPDNEGSLLDFAQAGTAAQVERFVGAWRRVDRVAAAEAETRYLSRQLSTSVDDDGMVVIRGRLTPELGAVVQRALEAAADRLFREAQGEPRAERVADDVTPAQRRADALGLLAESALASHLDRGCAGDRYQVMLHMEAHASATSEDGLAGVMELDHAALYVSAETSRRLSCDAAVVRMEHGTDGEVLSVWRKTRTVPPSIRRALQARDHSCRFPGCTARRCDAHHVEHWVDGGATSLDNLLCTDERHFRSLRGNAASRSDCVLSTRRAGLGSTALTSVLQRHHTDAMVRTQIQLPDAVYARARRVAKAKEISLAELARRGIETILDQYPSPELIGADWTPPRVRSGGVKVPLERLKDYGEVEATSHQPKARRRE